MSKHTPGPWEALRKDPGRRFQVATVELFGIYSNDPEHGGQEVGMPESDARLIAAAPDLLEALLGVVRNFPTDSDLYELNLSTEYVRAAMDAYDKARAAIAKATGGQE